MDRKHSRFDYLSTIRDKKVSGISKIDPTAYKRRLTAASATYTDYAYREAVNRLKNLLSDSYAPSSHRPTFESTTFGHSDLHQPYSSRPIMSELSKYYPGTNIPRATCYTAPSHLPDTSFGQKPVPPPSTSYPDQSNQELLRFIERQENYIKQMEHDFEQQREELNNLKFKVQELGNENDQLQQNMQALEHLESDQETSLTRSTNMIVLESKISELEAKLSQAKIESKKFQEENETLKRRIASGAGLEIVETYKRQVDDLKREKYRLEDTVKRLQDKIESMKETEMSYFSKMRTRDFTDKGSSFEKSHLEIEIKRLKEDLEHQKDRYTNLQQEMNRRLAEERDSSLRFHTHKYEHHGSCDDISAKWDCNTSLQAEIERHKRVENDLKREITQKNLQLEDLRAEFRHKIKSLQTELHEATAIRDSLESENTHLKLQLERQERQANTEAMRLNSEITSLRQRLDRADSDLLQARREQLRLNEHISTLEKELAVSEYGREGSRQPEINRIINDMEQKHGSGKKSAKRRDRVSGSASQVPSALDKQKRMKAMERATENYSETQVVTATPTALNIVQRSVKEVVPPQSETETQQQHAPAVMSSSTTRKQRLEARTRELLNQLTLPLNANSTQGTNLSGVEPYMTLPCKLKVNIKISPRDSKTKNDSCNDDANFSNDEVVVAEIEEVPIEQTPTNNTPPSPSKSTA